MEVQKSTIIIPIRTELEMAKLAVKYAKKNQSIEHDYILIYDKNNSKETTPIIEGTIQLFPKDSDVLKPMIERHGLMNLVEYGIKNVKTDYFIYQHADQIAGPNFDKELFKYMAPKTTVCGTRIEPKIFNGDRAKFQEECGLEAFDFDYNKFESACKKYSEDKVVEGLFAPHLFKTDEWINYDMNFAPQSREETDLAMTLLKNNYKLLNSRSAMFYHFAGRGSRRKNDPIKDSDEWKKSNYKNERNFIRKWRQPILTNEYCMPIKLDFKETVALGIGFKYDDNPELVKKFLRYHEPYFDKVYISIDSTKNPETIINTINNYIQEEASICEIFDPLKFTISLLPLNDDFSAMRNNIMNMNKCDWILQMDPDEFIDLNDLQNIRELVKQANNQKTINVLGLPRVNFIDNKIVNDLERDARGNFIGV